MKLSYSKAVVFLIFISAVFIKMSDKNFGRQGNYGVVDWDNFGYYLYLPAVFIYDDLKLQDEETIIHIQNKYDLSTSYYQAHRIHNGNRVIQYTSGLAIIYSPAFFVGHFWASLSSKHAVDGFSFPYQFSILIEAFLILFLGLFYLRKFALSFFSEKATILILIVIGFGTNFLQLASINVSSPHIVLFTAYCVALYYTYAWHQNPSNKNILIVATVIALMTLSRPNELLFVIIPIFWIGGVFGSLKEKLRFVLKNPIQIVLAAVPFLIFGVIQPFYWQYISGEWIFDTYVNEGFKLLDPYIIEFLFSFKKGWLLYTPIMAFSFLGFIFFYKKNKALFYPFLVFAVFNIWILSSWDCWWYAGSFSQRAIVQSYPVFILPLGYLLDYEFKNNGLKLFIYALLGLLLFFNLFQTYQFNKGVIDASRMTKAYYFATFFDVTPDDEKKILLEPARDISYIPDHEKLNRFIIYKDSFSEVDSLKRIADSQNNYHEGSLILSSERGSSKSFSFPYSQYCDTTYAYFVARIRYRSEYEAKENPFGIVVETKDSRSGKRYKYVYRGVEHIDWFEKGSWSSMDLVFIPPYLRSKQDSLTFYLYNFGGKPVEIDQFYIELLEPSSTPKINKKQYFNDYHTLKIGDWSKENNLVLDKGYEQIDSTYKFSSTLTISTNELTSSKLKFEFRGLALEKENSEIYAVVEIKKNDGEQIYYKSFKVDSEVAWGKQSFLFSLPSNLSQGGVLKAYLYNARTSPYLIRQLDVEN